MEKKRILVVDDEAAITRLLKLYLEGSGSYEVMTVNEGARALDVAREFQPDLVVLDLMMADMDGATVASEFKDEASLQDTPVIFLTALISEAEVGAHGKEIAGHPFLAKPVDPEKVVELIEKQLG